MSTTNTKMKKRTSSTTEDSIKYRKFEAYVGYQTDTNIAINKVFGDFFSILFQSEKMQKKLNITNIDLISGIRLRESIELISLGVREILINFYDLRLFLKFDIYRATDNTKRYELSIYSSQKTKIKDKFIYNELLKLAIESSDIKGKYISLKPNELDWKITEITDRGFPDIHLPNIISNELRLYKKVFKKQEFLMRYLFVGIPGTGKTESTIVLQNELNKLGVTIIKTTICDIFKEKVQLAEMLAPSIIILDDIDLVLGSRNNGQFSSNLRDFLDVLDGTEKVSDNVGIIATTNSVSLLYVAAKRPGRFHKVILFDELTKENIEQIVIKSLKINFGLEKIDPSFTNKETIELYKTKGLTGSHIFNITELLFRKYQILELNGQLTEKWVTDEIKNEITLLEKTQNFNTKIEETFKNPGGGNGLGFNGSDGIREAVEKLYEDDDESEPENVSCAAVKDEPAGDSRKYNQ